MAESRWLRLAAGVAAWTLVGVFVSTETFIGATYTQRPLGWSEALAGGLAAWYVRGALSPVVMLAARRMPIVPAHLARRVATHLGLGLGWAVVATAAIQWGSTSIV